MDYDNTFFLNSFQDVQSICEPLSKIGITSFNYSIVRDNGSLTFLTTNPALCENHFLKQYPLFPSFDKKLIKKKFFVMPEKNQSTSYEAIDEFKRFNVDNTLFLFERFNDYYEVIIFGTFIGNDKIFNSYLNNLESLEKFKLIFKEKAHKLIAASEKNKILVPTSMLNSVKNITSNINSSKDNPDIFTLASLKYLRLNINGKEIKLSVRERECISHLKKGKSSKEIARMLDLSYRTIESYLENIKNKLGCSKRSEIISIIKFLDE